MTRLDRQNYIQQISIDCVIFGYDMGELKVLLPKLNLSKDYWALPSGYIYQNEGIDQAASRILEERTGITEVFLEQFRVFGDFGRNNMDLLQEILTDNDCFLGEGQISKEDFEWITKRFISIGYYALVDINKVIPQKSPIDSSIDWYNVNELPKLIMDHDEMVNFARQTVQQNIDDKLIGFNLLPETFTMKELQNLYEAIFNKPLSRNNFQKKMLDLNVLERLEKKFTGAANKAPYLYRFKSA